MDGPTPASAAIASMTDFLNRERPLLWDKQPAVFADLNEPAVRMVNGVATMQFHLDSGQAWDINFRVPKKNWKGCEGNSLMPREPL